MENLKTIIRSKFLPFVQKPLRYTGGELNSVCKNLEDIKLHGVLCFPDLYDIGMSHYGLQLLYHIINSNPSWSLSRAFAPWVDAEELMRTLSIPLFSLEHLTPVKDADWIGFSVQYELQYTNIINMIDLAGIEVYSKNRTDSDPIIIAGGPCMGNPEPLTPFIDAFVIGDGEEVVKEICDTLETLKLNGATKQQKLQKIGEIQGLYVPSFFKVCDEGRYTVHKADESKSLKPAKIAYLDQSTVPEHPIVPMMNVVHHRFAAEVMRGCTRGCRFCAAGMYYRPVRERNPEDVHKKIKAGVSNTGWRDVGLLSLSTADYSCFSELLFSANSLKEKNRINISIPSTRIDALSNEQLDKLGAISSMSSFTIAPEAASMRLRSVINKDFTDDDIYRTVELLLSRNVQTLKLYFMIGLPTEDSSDIDAIISMVRKISQMMRASSKRKKLNVAISPFSPKANTPFQWDAMERIEELLKKGRYIKSSLYDRKNVRVSYRDPTMTFLESIIARGDMRVGDLVYEAWKKGARFDGWDEMFNIERWYESAQEIDMNLHIYTDALDSKQPLPWQAVNIGVSEKFLLKEREKALKQVTTQDCRTEKCTMCGVCNNLIKSKYADANTTISSGTETVVVNDTNKNSSYFYRVMYSKGDRVKYLGHLDMVNVFHRALMAASVPLAFSQGFNPHPKISFGPPLPLAVTGEAEAFDMELHSELNFDLKKINAWLPQDLKIIEYEQFNSKQVSLTSTVKAADYAFFPLEQIEMEIMKERLQLLLERDELIVEIQKKGKIKYKDIRPLILEATCNVKNGPGFWVARLSLMPSATCKPSEFLSFLCPENKLSDFDVKRERLVIKT
ncbi:TIGR03960 family B12-binding radical SAM protein [Chitinispirillales bacterium ANBcel5]|uniref:TIGR03960 family B12-binding radical SAM protein n=1 Tax=Cellulosispirillum alkaliphilum TaxID=3039283 RepID=UPI002A4E99A5|nr:TIGR03960 family B12-binding radical SAM protein [Chitinispirillales bacterium ANBcel5]